jgi:uncharacterized membrane protein YjgN (DUF898 family)
MTDLAALGPIAVLIAACTVGMLLALPVLATAAVRGSIRGVKFTLAFTAGMAICAILLASILTSELA